MIIPLHIATIYSTISFYLTLTIFEPHLGHAICLCSVPQAIQQNLIVLWLKIPNLSNLLLLPNKDIVLYSTLMPPIPLFLRTISVLTILDKKNTKTDTTNDRGNGNMNEIAKPRPRYIQNQIQKLFRTWKLLLVPASLILATSL